VWLDERHGRVYVRGLDERVNPRWRSRADRSSTELDDTVLACASGAPGSIQCAPDLRGPSLEGGHYLLRGSGVAGIPSPP